MANVLLTTKCNLACAYCFAQQKLQDSRNQTMSLSDVGKVIEFLKRSGHPVFRAMGGEPTLHPQFPRIMQLALEAGMRFDVLSNATWPESYNTLFNRISPRRLFFLLNIDHPDNYPPKIWDRIQGNLAEVARRGNVTLSFNIFETQPRSEYILDLVRSHGIDKLRMSFSLPVLGARNAYLKLEDQKRMAPFVMEFIRRAKALGVEVKFDNVVPPCMFSYEQAGELLLEGVLDLKRNMRCDPIIDIGPDLTVWCCFCLSKLWNRHLGDFQNLQEIQAYYREAMSLYQGRLFPMEECSTCQYRELWGCQGGCLTYTVMKHGELAVVNKPAEPASDGWQPGVVLALSPNVEIERYDIPEESYAVYDKTSGLEMEVGVSFQPLLTMLNGQYSAQQVVDRFAQNGQNLQPEGPLAVFAQLALKQAAQDLLLGLLHQGFLVVRNTDGVACDEMPHFLRTFGDESLCVEGAALRTL
jgi:radical SAM protein with 4Fe4S-binding SPASM domain